MDKLHPEFHAETTPDKPALKFVPSGKMVSYGELNAKSNQASHLMRSIGLERGDVIAIFMHNRPEYFETAWAADRAGLYYTGISTQLTAEEVAYILADSGAKALFTSGALIPVASEALQRCPRCTGYVVDGASSELHDYAAERDRYPVTPIADQSRGMPMLYSSGTTGRPKGVKFPLPDLDLGGVDPLTKLLRDSFGLGGHSVYLSPAPLYHSAPLRFCMTVNRLGGTAVVLEKFDPELSLQTIEVERVTESQWVPTHFVRMLKMPPENRARYDLSSHRFAIHAAAPCPVPVKQEMIEWWGPIIHEYYSGTEFNGMTVVRPDEWLAHPGTVGRAAVGTVHVMDDDGSKDLPPRSEGLIYFEGGSRFAYHNDPEKTAGSYNAHGWSTLGDVGWLDEEGFLYLTDRKSFMIISGGVNIYPQEIEDAIIESQEALPAVPGGGSVGASPTGP